jgi:c-di-GMP-related signal transduction protein
MANGIGFKLSNVLEAWFEEHKRQLNIVEFPLTEEEFYHIMRNRLKVSDRTIDNYWKYVQVIGLMTMKDGLHHIDLDALFDDYRFDKEMVHGKEVRTRLDNDYGALLSIADQLGTFTLDDIARACTSEGIEKTSEDIEMILDSAKKRGELYNTKDGYYKSMTDLWER